MSQQKLRNDNLPSGSQTKLPADAIIPIWLRSLTLTVLEHLTSRVLPSLPTLTNMGVRQLLSDLEYLSNIICALNVDWEELDYCKQALVVDADYFWTRPGSSGDAPYSQIQMTVAKLRGLSEPD